MDENLSRSRPGLFASEAAENRYGHPPFLRYGQRRLFLCTEAGGTQKRRDQQGGSQRSVRRDCAVGAGVGAYAVYLLSAGEGL